MLLGSRSRTWDNFFRSSPALGVVDNQLCFGLGVQPPSPSWGAIIHDGQNVLVNAWWIALFPGLAIFSLTISLHALSQQIKK